MLPRASGTREEVPAARLEAAARTRARGRRAFGRTKGVRSSTIRVRGVTRSSKRETPDTEARTKEVSVGGAGADEEVHSAGRPEERHDRTRLACDADDCPGISFARNAVNGARVAWQTCPHELAEHGGYSVTEARFQGLSVPTKRPAPEVRHRAQPGSRGNGGEGRSRTEERRWGT